MKSNLTLIKIKIFLLVISSIFIFYLFGKNNLIVGIGAIITASTMFKEDYKGNILSTTLLFSTINVIIGIFAYITNLNPLLGIILTFFISFIIYYVFSYDAKPLKSLGFITTYLNLVYSPVELNYMPIRLLALIFSGILIMLLYCAFSKYDFHKIINNEIIEVVDLILDEINLILTDKTIHSKNKLINTRLKNIELKIYEKIEKSRKDLNSIYIKYIIIVLCKKISTLIPLLKKRGSNIALLKKIKKIFEDIKLYILNENNLENLKFNLENHYNNLKTKNLLNDIDKYNYYSLKASIEEAYICIKDIDNTTHIYMNETIKLLKLIKENMYGLKNNFTMTSLRFNLAVKASILISLSIFIVNYFHIYEGQWTIYAIIVFLLPYAEQTNQKIKDRVLGTIIGSILFNIINFIINGNIIFMIILLIIFAYFSIFTVPYHIKCIFITFTSMLSIKIMYPTNVILILTEYRILFTLIAAIVTAIIINIFFPYTLRNDTINTLTKYIDLNESLLDELKKDKIDKNRLDIMILTDNYLWKKINYNNKELKFNDIDNLLSEQSNFITDISFLFKTGSYLDNNHAFIKSISENLKVTINQEDLEKKAKQIFTSLSSDTERLILIHICKIHSHVKNIYLLAQKIINNL